VFIVYLEYPELSYEDPQVKMIFLVLKNLLDKFKYNSILRNIVIL
jgi:hypothetical protein